MTIDLDAARKLATEAQERADKAVAFIGKVNTTDDLRDWLVAEQEARARIPQLAALIRDMADEIERIQPDGIALRKLSKRCFIAMRDGLPKHIRSDYPLWDELNEITREGFDRGLRAVFEELRG